MGLAEFPNFDAAMRLRLAAATNRLAEEFDGIYDRQAIGALVEESAESLSARGITPFVHILAERFARERLRAQAQSEAFTKPLTPEVPAAADVVVTMARSVEDVQIPHTVRHVDWRIGNPGEADLDEVRRVREDIEHRVDVLAEELIPATQAASTTA